MLASLVLVLLQIFTKMINMHLNCLLEMLESKNRTDLSIITNDFHQSLCSNNNNEFFQTWNAKFDKNSKNNHKIVIINLTL